MNDFNDEDRRNLKKLCIAVCGDDNDLEIHPGLLRITQEISNDVYGNSRTKTRGIKEKTEIMWEGRIKILAVAGAMGTVAGMVVWIVNLLFK